MQGACVPGQLSAQPEQYLEVYFTFDQEVEEEINLDNTLSEIGCQIARWYKEIIEHNYFV